MAEFRRPHHRRIAAILAAMDSKFLMSAGCYFGGGTQIALALDEYRESTDIDFLCASGAGFRQLRESVTENSLGLAFRRAPQLAREVRADRDGIRTFIAAGDVRIKFEIVLEARIPLAGAIDTKLGVPALDLDHMIAEKLLANADRGLDTSTGSRDAVDLAFLAARHGRAALGPGLEIAERAYGTAIMRSLERVLAYFASHRNYAGTCARALGIEDRATLNKGLSVLRAFVRQRSGQAPSKKH